MQRVWNPIKNRVLLIGFLFLVRYKHSTVNGNIIKLSTLAFCITTNDFKFSTHFTEKLKYIDTYQHRISIINGINKCENMNINATLSMSLLGYNTTIYIISICVTLMDLSN